MKSSNLRAARRLARLQRVLDGRRARLASTLSEQSRRVVPSGPLDGLRRYGYPVALVLAALALLPTVGGIAWRRRKLLAGMASNAWGIAKLRRQFDAVRTTGSDR